MKKVVLLMKYVLPSLIIIFSVYLVYSIYYNLYSNSFNIFSLNKVDSLHSGDNLIQSQTVSTVVRDYYFGPKVSTVNGTLKVETYYGQPNFGESPETDAKETIYILYLDRPINIISETKDADYDVTTSNVIRFQLAPQEQIVLEYFINKKVVVTGEFYTKHTGHHHTDVLMFVSEVKSQDGDFVF